MSENKSSSKGASEISILTIAFVVLKLCHVIDWSWWWVLSPIWILVGLWLLIVIIIEIIKGNE